MGISCLMAHCFYKVYGSTEDYPWPRGKKENSQVKTNMNKGNNSYHIVLCKI